MRQNNQRLVALDVGEKRIGVAAADTMTKFPYVVGTVDVDDMVIKRLREVIAEIEPAQLVVGYPRNQAGEITAQTRAVVQFCERLTGFGLPIVFQDESLTSVLAEEHLKKHRKSYTKADIDAHAAVIILSDYLETHYA